MGNTERVSTLAYSLIFAGAGWHVSGIKISGEKGSELARGIQDKQPVFTFQEILPGTGIRVERTESKAGAVPADETDKDVMNTLYYGDNLIDYENKKDIRRNCMRKTVDNILRVMVLVILVAIGLNGCADTLKESLMHDEYPSYSNTIKSAINKGQLLEGMTENQVYLAMSNQSIYSFKCVQSDTHYKDVDSIIWSYKTIKSAYEEAAYYGNSGYANNCAFNTFYICFTNGKVVGWKTSELSKSSPNKP